MAIGFVVNNSVNSLRAYAVFASQRTKGFACCIAFANFTCVMIRKLSVRATTAMERIAAALVRSVAVIVDTCAKKEMLGVYTRGIIASMEYEQAVGDWRYTKVVGKAMRFPGFAIVINRAVSIFRAVALPFPAFIDAASVYPFPKTYVGGVGFVAQDKAIRLILSEPSAQSVFLAKLCFLTTSAVAITVGNVVRGMISHVKVSFKDFGQAWDVSSVARHFLLVTTGVFYHRSMVLTYGQEM